jgi:hypothetical protein
LFNSGLELLLFLLTLYVFYLVFKNRGSLGFVSPKRFNILQY